MFQIGCPTCGNVLQYQHDGPALQQNVLCGVCGSSFLAQLPHTEPVLSHMSNNDLMMARRMSTLTHEHEAAVRRLRHQEEEQEEHMQLQQAVSASLHDQEELKEEEASQLHLATALSESEKAAFDAERVSRLARLQEEARVHPKEFRIRACNASPAASLGEEESILLLEHLEAADEAARLAEMSAAAANSAATLARDDAVAAAAAAKAAILAAGGESNGDIVHIGRHLNVPRPVRPPPEAAHEAAHEAALAADAASAAAEAAVAMEALAAEAARAARTIAEAAATGGIALLSRIEHERRDAEHAATAAAAAASDAERMALTTAEEREVAEAVAMAEEAEALAAEAEAIAEAATQAMAAEAARLVEEMAFEHAAEETSHVIRMPPPRLTAVGVAAAKQARVEATQAEAAQAVLARAATALTTKTETQTTMDDKLEAMAATGREHTPMAAMAPLRAEEVAARAATPEESGRASDAEGVAVVEETGQANEGTERLVGLSARSQQREHALAYVEREEAASTPVTLSDARKTASAQETQADEHRAGMKSEVSGESEPSGHQIRRVWRGERCGERRDCAGSISEEPLSPGTEHLVDVDGFRSTYDPRATERRKLRARFEAQLQEAEQRRNRALVASERATQLGVRPDAELQWLSDGLSVSRVGVMEREVDKMVGVRTEADHESESCAEDELLLDDLLKETS